MESIDENRVRDIVREELVNFTPQKKKRAPNKWQTFLKECVKEQEGEIPYMDKVKACSAKYKESKNKDSNNPPPEQPIPSTRPTPIAQPVLPVQPTQPVQYVQPAQPTQSAQPTYHTQQVLTEDDVERLIRLSNEKLIKMARGQ